MDAHSTDELARIAVALEKMDKTLDQKLERIALLLGDIANAIYIAT